MDLENIAFKALLNFIPEEKVLEIISLAEQAARIVINIDARLSRIEAALLINTEENDNGRSDDSGTQ